jgi:hypothetical protein
VIAAEPVRRISGLLGIDRLLDTYPRVEAARGRPDMNTGNGIRVSPQPLLEIMRRCVALPWVTETGSLAPSRGAGRGVTGVFCGDPQRRAGRKVHSRTDVPPVVTACAWTVRGRLLDRCRSPLDG